jgi:hypothetical protein
MPDEDEDTALLQELARVMATADPVPPDVVAAAKASFTWRTIDAELAELAFDSLLDADAVLVRGDDQPRLLTFANSSVTIELVVVIEAAGRRVVGQLVPEQQATIELVHSGGTASAQADELGRFRAEPLGSGPMRLRVVPIMGGPVTETDWVAI